MRRAAAALVLALPAPAAAAQGMDPNMPGMRMPGMTMPPAPRAKAARPAPKRSAPPRAPAAAPARAAAPASARDGSAPGHMPGMAAPPPAVPGAAGVPDMAAMPGMSGMAMPAPAAGGTALPAGDAPPPAAPADRAADRFYPAAAMAMANRRMRREHGGMAIAQVMLNLAELQVRGGRAGYRWEGMGRFGGDVDRLVVKSEGEGRFGRAADEAEAQALYAHAIGPYVDLQAGVRGDFGAGAKRGYATLGLEGLAPYGIDVAAALFLSHRGDLLGRLEGRHDQRLTQRLILQPRVELNLAAQDVPASRLAAGLATAELGLRLRYEIARTVAPYAGVSWDRRTSGSARFARAAGEPVGTTALVLGVRCWF